MAEAIQVVLKGHRMFQDTLLKAAGTSSWHEPWYVDEAVYEANAQALVRAMSEAVHIPIEKMVPLLRDGVDAWYRVEPDGTPFGHPGLRAYLTRVFGEPGFA